MTRHLIPLVFLIAACVAPPRGGGVRPAPPGPFDAVRAVWGDYSGMCPKNYDFCRANHPSFMMSEANRELCLFKQDRQI